MGIAQLDDSTRNFLLRLYEKTGGDLSATASMYDIGEMTGMERGAAAKTAELLIGNGLAEIKTLSGGIGLTQATLDEMENAGLTGDTETDQAVLSNAAVVTPADIQAVAEITAEIKYRINELGLEFDLLDGMVTDLKTIDVQLTSPSAKTAIIRECFTSIHDGLKKGGNADIRDRVAGFLGM